MHAIDILTSRHWTRDYLIANVTVHFLFLRNIFLRSTMLTDFQKDITTEMLKHVFGGGLSLPMGSGKTLISLEFAKSQNLKTLVVVSKTLVPVWQAEIEKFYGDSLSHFTLFKDDIEDFGEELVTITTPETLVTIFKNRHVESKFTDTVGTVKHYYVPRKPLCNSGVYGFEWDCIFIDEIQQYTNCETKRCLALASLCAKQRWGLSGTMFTEPSISRVLGYYLILNLPDFPRNMPEAERRVTSPLFKGLGRTIVHRQTNEAFKAPKVLQEIVSHEMYPEEQTVYTVMRELMKNIQIQVRQQKNIGNTQGLRLFSSYRLAMLTYLRQAVTCPLIPVTSAAIDSLDWTSSTGLSTILMRTLKRHGLDNYLSRRSSLRSSRVAQVLEKLEKFSEKRVVIFTCFRTSLDVIKHYVSETGRPVFTVKGTDKIDVRRQAIQSFEDTDASVLLLTYSIGSEGLNLQKSHTVFLVDFWWNQGKTSQAIARVLRYGQTSDKVHIVYFTSNTAIERVIFEKQKDKKEILESVLTGPYSAKEVKRINLNEIITFVTQEENTDRLGKLQRVKQYRVNDV